MPKHEAAALTRSLEQYGAVEPAVVNADGTIIGGHMRVEAARQLGWAEFPVVRVELDDAHARLLNLALNRIHGEWDEEMLAEMLAGLRDEDADLVLSGFDSGEIDRLLASFGEPGGDTEPMDVPADPRTRPGDLYALGEHRLLCGDSTVRDDVEWLMDGAVAEMCFTDPPYGVDYDGGTVVREKLAGDTTTELYGPCCAMAFAFTVEDAPLYLWHAGVKGIAAAAAAAAAAAGWEIRCEIVWNKNQAQFGALSAQYKQKHEPAYYCFKRGSGARWAGPTNEITVWDVDRAAANEFHPTQKPIALAERALRNHSSSSVLDLFAGSGSTLIACENLGRRCYAMEIDPGYCDVIVDRWERHTGRKAELGSAVEAHA